MLEIKTRQLNRERTSIKARNIWKSIVTIIIVVFLLFWICRIINLNIGTKVERVYDPDEIVKYNGIELRDVESCIFSIEEFKKHFLQNPENVECGDMILSVCIEYKNITKESIEWDDLFDPVEAGFECVTWASASDPNIGCKINILHSDRFEPGMIQKIWYFTPLSPISFSNNTWENISTQEFYFIINLSPEKEAIRLENT